MTVATCQKDGEQRRDCSVCDVYETEAITNGTHSYTAWTVIKEATCTEGGIKEQECRYCGGIKSDVIKPTGHTMGEWVVEKSATCTVEGTETSSCENCDHKVSQSIAAIGHDYIGEVTEPDCINGGYTTYTCDNCGDIYTDDVTDPTGHDYEANVTNADCENSGYTTYTCKSCYHSYVGDEVKALSHDYVSEVTAPDCENGGYTTNTCSRCDDTYTDTETKPLGHKWDKGVVTKEPGEYTSGTKEYTCELCGEIKTEVLGALGHTHVYSSVVTPATCTTEGYTTYTCNCGNSYNDDYEAASGHKYGTWYTYTAATCTKVGEKRSDCANCDAYQSDTIAVIAHSFSKYVSDGNATCTKDGTKTAKCDNCSLTDTVADAGTKLGHSWGAWEETKAATSAAEGEEMRSCDRCGDSEFRTIPKLTHPFVDVPAGKFYEVPVIWAVNNDITNGIDETHFAPDNICNRGQVVTFLWRAAGSPEPTSSYNPFTDVKEGKFYYKAVLWAVEEGITKGTSATTFSPNDNCTRGHVATFLWRTLGEPNASSSANPFTDVAQGKFYYDAVLWAAETGVTTGMTATTFEPNRACTRGQIVTFLYRALG